MTAPTLDGTANGHSSSSTTVAATLTTAGTDDIICAMVAVENGSGTMLYVTGIAGGGLTWQKRSGITQGQYTIPGAVNSGVCCIELWWAVAATAQTATTITATFSGTCDDSAMIVFGVNGCHTAQPWDNNVTVPAIQPWTGPQSPSFTNISTTEANDFLIFGMADNSGTNVIGTVPSGFTEIDFINNPGGSLFCTVGAAYQGVTSAQSNQTFTWGSPWVRPYALFDALTADTGALTPVPQIEVVNTNNFTGASATVVIASPSTTSTIVLVSYIQQSTAPAITGISGGSLTWTKRAISDGSHRGRIEVWTAPVVSGLAVSTATVTYAAGGDAGTVCAFSLLNCTSAIFDSNVGLPDVLSNTGSVVSWTPSISGVSTSQTTDLIMAVVGTAWFTGTGQETPPTNFLLISTASNGGGALGDNYGVAIMPVGTAQSSQTYAWGAAVTDDSSTNAGGEFYIDAFTSASAAPPASGGVFFSSIT